MALLVLSVVGSDRPGLTQAVAGVVLSVGGNWLESRLSRLGGLFGSVLVELEAGAAEGLRAAVTAIDAQGLEVRIAPAIDGPAVDGEILQLELVCQDRAGIVNQVAGALSALNANIEAFETWLSLEAHSGMPLFHMRARLRLPPTLKAEAVQAALEALSGEIMVDISVGSPI